MPITPDRLNRLREFGLSEYAARAYLALLDLGVAEARDVSTLSKVPQAKIYHVLEQLHEKGLAVILPEFPKKYAPVPFSEYLQRLHEEHARAADAISRDREVLAEMFRVMGDTDVGDRGFFTVVRGRRNVMAKLVEMVSNSKNDVLVMATPGFALRQAHLAQELKDARARDVRVRVLVPLTPETMANIEPMASFVDVRTRELDDALPSSGRVALVVADGARAFLVNFLPDDDNVYAGKDVAVYTDQEAMVAALAALVEPRWAAASTFDEQRETLATGRLPDATRAYTTRETARAALDDAFARRASVREVRILDSQAALAPAEDSLALIDRARAAGARYRAILNVADVDTARSLAAILEASPGCDVRHLMMRTTTRFALFDDREALVSMADLSVHTTNAAAVQSLRAQFEDAWTRAMPLGRRLEELEVFPHIQPRDIGMGRLFQDVRDPIFVADASGRILLWNDAATSAFGYAVPDALKLRVADVLPDAVGSVREAAAGASIESNETTAIRNDGEPTAVDLALYPARDASSGVTYVLAIARLSGTAGKRLEVRGDQERVRRANRT